MKPFYISIIVFCCIFSEKIHAQSPVSLRANVGNWDKLPKPTVPIPHANPLWVGPQFCIFNEDHASIMSASDIISTYNMLSGLNAKSGKRPWSTGSYIAKRDNFIYLTTPDSAICCRLCYLRNPERFSICFYFDPNSEGIRKYITVSDGYYEITANNVRLYIKEQVVGRTTESK